MLLRQSEIAPDELRKWRLKIVGGVSEKYDIMSALDGLRRKEEAIRRVHDQETSEAIITDAIGQACLTVETERRLMGDAGHATRIYGEGEMFGATVDRRQFAVGHGGFHAGRIQVLQSRSGLIISALSSRPKGANLVFDQSYVYDCGSEHPDAFAEAMRSYGKDFAEKFEMLFASHLHADHINGLDRLLGYKTPAVVVLPYLDLEDLALIVVSDFESGRFSANYQSYVRDPVSWWHNRGVKTVIFIEPGGGGDAPPDGPQPDSPIFGGDRLAPLEWDYAEPAVRLAAVLRKPMGSVPPDLVKADPASVDVRELGQPAVLAGPGSLFRLEWKYDARDEWRSGDWCLVPYVHPVQDAQRAAFRSAVRAHLRPAGAAPAEFRERLLAELSSSKQAKALIEVYSDHFPRDHNAVSMSLYSGPEARQQRQEKSYNWQTNWRSSERGRAHRKVLVPSGWLGTGDSMLKQQKRRSPWRQFYSRFGSNIGALTLPHHGSIHNFDEEILAWDDLRFAIATTVKREARIADLEKTLENVKEADKLGLIVDDEPANSISSRSERLFSVSDK